MHCLKVEPGSDSETCQDGNQVIDTKAEDVADMQEDEDPMLVIKAEQEVCLSMHC
jgi:hypothetical protein